MKRGKKVLAFLMTAAMTISVASCGSNETKTGDKSTPTQTTASSETPKASATPKMSAWLQAAELDKPDTTAALYEKAKSEGKVVVYSMSSRIKDIKTSFEAQYPGVVLEGYDMRNNEVEEKTAREYQAGINNVDVIFIKDSDGVLTNEFIKKGIAHKYVPQDIGSKVDDMYKKDAYSIYLETKQVFYNTEIYQTSPIKNWWDLTKPEWKGKIMLTNPTAAIETIGLFNAFVQHPDEMAKAYKDAFGEDIKLNGTENAGYEWIKRFAANDLILTGSDQEVTDAIGAPGQKTAPIGIATSSKIRDVSKGKKLGLVYDIAPVTSVANPAYLAIVDNSKHVNAAKLLIRFMAGEADGASKGLTPFLTEGSWPTRSDVPSKDKTPLKNMKLWPENAELNYKNLDKVSNFWISVKK